VLYLDDPASKTTAAAPVVEADHGRIETRTATVPRALSDWTKKCNLQHEGRYWSITMSARALLAACALCRAFSAEAADQSAAIQRGPYSAYFPSAVLWTGPYVGLHLGGVWTSATWTDPFSKASDNPQASSPLGGAQFGVNWQTDNWVYGAETSASWLELSGTAVDATGTTHKIRAHWLATATGRLGYAFGRYLVYGKGGGAFTGERNEIVDPLGKTASTGTQTQVGGTGGGGVEYSFDTHWSWRLEYDFIEFPSQNLTLVGLQPEKHPLGNAAAHVNWTWHEFVGALNYRF
jgi:outer membrane immunogenic protein